MIPSAATLLASALPVGGAKSPVVMPGDGFADLLAGAGKTVCLPPGLAGDAAIVDAPPVGLNRQEPAALGDPLPAASGAGRSKTALPAQDVDAQQGQNPTLPSVPADAKPLPDLLVTPDLIRGPCEPPATNARPAANASHGYRVRPGMTTAEGPRDQRADAFAKPADAGQPARPLPTLATAIAARWTPEHVRGDDEAPPAPDMVALPAIPSLPVAVDVQRSPIDSLPKALVTSDDADREPGETPAAPIVPATPLPSITPVPVAATNMVAGAVRSVGAIAAPVSIATTGTATIAAPPSASEVAAIASAPQTAAPVDLAAPPMDLAKLAPAPAPSGLSRPASERTPPVAAPVAPGTTHALRARANVAFPAAVIAPSTAPPPAIEPLAIDLAPPAPTTHPIAPAPAIEPLAALHAAAPVTAAADTRNDGWMTAMIDRIETLRDTPGTREMRVRLTPDALGGIEVRLRETPEGMQVHLTAETPAARALLAEAAPRLSDMAEARGLKLAQQGTDAQHGGQPGQPRDTEQQRARRNPLPAATAADEPVSEQRIA